MNLFKDIIIKFHGVPFRITWAGNMERIFEDGDLERLAPSKELTDWIENQDHNKNRQ